MKKTLPLIILSLIILIGVVWLFKNKNTPGPTEIIFFYGDGCPHCASVEDYITKNNIEPKVTFSRREVWRNKENLELLVKLASGCGIAQQDMRVPMLWDGSTCHQGDKEIINFFGKKAGISQ